MAISDIIRYVTDYGALTDAVKDNQSIAFKCADFDPFQIYIIFNENKLFDYSGTVLIQFPLNPINWMMFFDSLNKKLKYPLHYAFYDITTSQKYYFFQNNIPSLTPINVLEGNKLLLNTDMGLWLNFFDRPQAANSFELERSGVVTNISYPVFLDSPELFNAEITESELFVFMDNILSKNIDWRIITLWPEHWEQRTGYTKIMEN